MRPVNRKRSAYADSAKIELSLAQTIATGVADTREVNSLMLIARIVGTTIATIKDEKLVGQKLLICRETDETGQVTGKPYVAVDTVDAGVGDLVLTAHGSSGRQTTITKDRPVDAVIMAIVESLDVGGEVTYQKEYDTTTQRVGW